MWLQVKQSLVHFDSFLLSEMNEENNEVLKYLGEDIALKALFNEFHVLGILFSVMSVGKKDSGKLFWSYLILTNSFKNKFMSGIGAYIGILLNASS